MIYDVYGVPETSIVDFGSKGWFRTHEYERVVSGPVRHHEERGFVSREQPDGLQNHLHLVGPHCRYGHVSGVVRR